MPTYNRLFRGEGGLKLCFGVIDKLGIEARWLYTENHAALKTAVKVPVRNPRGSADFERFTNLTPIGSSFIVEVADAEGNC